MPPEHPLPLGSRGFYAAFWGGLGVLSLRRGQPTQLSIKWAHAGPIAHPA